MKIKIKLSKHIAKEMVNLKKKKKRLGSTVGYSMNSLSESCQTTFLRIRKIP